MEQRGKVWTKRLGSLLLAIVLLALTASAQAEPAGADSKLVKEKTIVLKTAAGLGDRGFLGVVPRPLDHVLRAALEYEEPGVLLAEIVPDGPASKAGLKVGDVLVRLGGKPVHDVERLHALMGEAKPGETVDVVLMHAGKTRTVKVTLGERPAAEWGALPEGLESLDIKDFPGTMLQEGGETIDVEVEGMDEGDGPGIVRILRGKGPNGIIN